jgi:hypothetical protein
LERTVMLTRRAIRGAEEQIRHAVQQAEVGLGG